MGVGKKRQERKTGQTQGESPGRSGKTSYETYAEELSLRGAAIQRDVDAMRAARSAAYDPKQPHPTAGPQAVTGNGLIGILRASRQVAAGIADETGKRQLIETHECGAKKASGSFPERTGEVTMHFRRSLKEWSRRPRTFRELNW